MRPADPATESQINYARSLMARRNSSTVQDMVRIVELQIVNGKITHGTISSAINVLKNLPVVETIAARDREARTGIQEIINKIPEGYYAIKTADSIDGTRWMFYKVDKPTSGRWKGFIFIKVQAGDEYHPIKNPQYKHNILRAIAMNPRQAAIDYGNKIGRCAICNRTLTDADSIGAGIGPICAKRFGW